MAAALALVAVVTRRPSTMRHRQVGDAVGHDAPAELPPDRVAGHEGAAGQRHRRQELTVRKLLEPLARSADADETLNAIVVRRQLGITDRPVFAVSIAARRFEVVLAEPVALARPAERPASDLAAANPHERLVDGKRVRILVVVDEKLVTVVVAGVAQPLHRLALQQALLV